MLAVRLKCLVIIALWLNAIAKTRSSNPGNREKEAASIGTKATPNFTLYYRSDALFQELDSLVARHPSSMILEVLEASASDYTAGIRVVTVADGATSPLDGRTRILLNFGQHGREMITSEVAMRLLRILGREDKLASTDHVEHILSKTVLKIIPMENANGRAIVENGSLCERRNGRGVDTNRNWDVNWGKKEKDYDPAEEFPGTAPFSEPETRILLEIAQSFKPHLWVNVHSGMQALFMPYDHKNESPDYETTASMKLLLETLNVLHCNQSCTIGSGGGTVGYFAHGNMYDKLKVRFAFTFEIYGDLNADRNDCFRMFNPTTPDAFEGTVSTWSLAFNFTNKPLYSKVGRTLWDSNNNATQNLIVTRELWFYLLMICLILCYISYKLGARISANKFFF